MSTPHIAAEKGEIAESILLPGDPLRAKFIAENFLESPKLYTDVRGILGYTGKYKGVPVSVQGTGMGIPSISIYTHELIKEYGVKKLFRVGTCGGMHPDVHLRDVLIAQAATTDSGIIRSTTMRSTTTSSANTASWPSRWRLLPSTPSLPSSTSRPSPCSPSATIC